MHIVVTGHRPNKVGGYNLPAFRVLMLVAAQYLKDSSVTLIHTGMAQGWDQAVATVAHKLHIPFCAHVPFPGQETRWSANSQTYYTQLLALAHYVRYVSGSPPVSSAHVRQLLLERNCRMLDQLAAEPQPTQRCVVALWDGTGGGTSYTVSRAKERGLEVVNLYDEYVKLSGAH